jgi:hypothetical protein
LMRTVCFLRRFFASSSSSPKPAATVGPRGGRGGGLFGCGCGSGFCSSDISQDVPLTHSSGTAAGAVPRLECARKDSHKGFNYPARRLLPEAPS